MILLRTALWIVPHLLLLICFFGLLRRARYRMFPMFFVYVLLEKVQFVFLFTISLLIPHIHSGLAIYQWGVILNVAINSSIQIAVLYEIVSYLILPHSSIAATLRPLMRWVAGLLVLLSIGIAAGFSESHIERVVHAFEVLNFAANLINLGLLLVLLLFTRALHISWRSLAVGIVMGFAVNSSAEMGAISLISSLGFRGVVPGDVVRMSGFVVCTLVWLIYLLLPERAPQFTGQGMQKAEMQTWEKELHGMIRR